MYMFEVPTDILTECRKLWMTNEYSVNARAAPSQRSKYFNFSDIMINVDNGFAFMIRYLLENSL